MLCIAGGTLQKDFYYKNVHYNHNCILIQEGMVFLSVPQAIAIYATNQTQKGMAKTNLLCLVP